MRRGEQRDRASWEVERALSGTRLSLEVLLGSLAWAVG